MSDAVLRQHHWTRPEWRRLVESGALGPTRLVLRHGKIVEKMNIGSRHAHVVDQLTDQLTVGLAGTDLKVRSQNPIALAVDDEPEPDVVVCVRKTYFEDHPGPADIQLIIEVADTSLRVDHDAMVDYAAAGIGEAWIVNIPARTVEVYTQPLNGNYQHTEHVSSGSCYAAGVAVNLSHLFPASATADFPKPVTDLPAPRRPND